MSSEDGASRTSRQFSREQRVRRRGEFQQVFDRGIRVQNRYFTLLLQPTQRPRSRLGIVASKKLGGAVMRNRAKRLIREMFRLLPSGGFAVDAVVIPRRELLDVPFSSLEAEFRNGWRRGLDRVRHGRS